MTDYLVHVAYVLSLCSFLVYDILWLRVLTVGAGCTILPYYLIRNPPLVAPAFWNGVFIAINVFHVSRLLLERRPVHLSENEQRLYQLAFRSLTPREFAKLLKIGRWKDAMPSQRIVEQGTVIDAIMVILSGTVVVKVDGRTVASLEQGRFLGEVSYLTGGKTSASVEAVAPTTYMVWPKGALEQFLRRSPDLRAALQFAIGRDLAAKLAAA